MSIPPWYWSLPVQLPMFEALNLVERHPRCGRWPEQAESTAAAWLLHYFGRFVGCSGRVTYGKVQRANQRQLCRDGRLR